MQITIPNKASIKYINKYTLIFIPYLSNEKAIISCIRAINTNYLIQFKSFYIWLIDTVTTYLESTYRKDTFGDFNGSHIIFIISLCAKFLRHRYSKAHKKNLKRTMACLSLEVTISIGVSKDVSLFTKVDESVVTGQFYEFLFFGNELLKSHHICSTMLTCSCSQHQTATSACWGQFILSPVCHPDMK